MADQPSPTHYRSTLRVQHVVVTPRDGSGPPFLVAEVTVECEGCGGFSGTIPGHHVRALQQALALVVADQPELCGPELNEQQVKRTEWQGTNPGKGKAVLN